MTFSSKTYIPNKENAPMILEEKLLWIGLTVSICGVLIMVLSDKIGGYDWLDLIGKIVGIIGLLVFFYGRLVGINKTEPLNGELNDQIIIKVDSIEIGNAKYLTSNINALEFFVGDYLGKIYPKPAYPGPWGSNGVKSSISFEINGQKIREYFMVTSKSQMLTLKNIQAEIKNTVANNTYSK